MHKQLNQSVSLSSSLLFFFPAATGNGTTNFWPLVINLRSAPCASIYNVHTHMQSQLLREVDDDDDCSRFEHGNLNLMRVQTNWPTEKDDLIRQ